VALRPTASQTVGPFFHIGLPWEGGAELVSPDHPDAIRIKGTVLDGEGTPVDDAMIELWQANRAGRYRHPEDSRVGIPLEEEFTGFGRAQTDDGGRFAFVTVKPGAVPGQAPHIAVSVFARGVLKRLATRIYFPDEEEANAADPVLSSIGDQPERSTLVARPEDGALRFDVHLQGDRQTAFLDV
jgi:protocatechuate 3,4-dioxygenase, alpha subunit